MLPANYFIRHLEPSDIEAIIAICQLVYPNERPYTREEIEDHRRVFPQGQFVAVESTSRAIAGAHFTLRLCMTDFHFDDPWDVLTAGGTFLDHDPAGPTLYGADLMVHPLHQHHGIGHALTEATRFLARDEHLWRMVGASRLPGYGPLSATETVGQYVDAVVRGIRSDPVLSVHLKDGWTPVRPIHGYLQHDPESANWAEVIQWVNPDLDPPFKVRRK
ncbi:MAG: GNAT family N-acetyltransferase [Phycisphaeraceae bacterium]|nr:GNAT family N-acetyltransferase [Phycisphaeraceae bacterium]